MFKIKQGWVICGLVFSLSILFSTPTLARGGGGGFQGGHGGFQGGQGGFQGGHGNFQGGHVGQYPHNGNVKDGYFRGGYDNVGWGGTTVILDDDDGYSSPSCDSVQMCNSVGDCWTQENCD